MIHIVIIGEQPTLTCLSPCHTNVIPVDALEVALISIKVRILDMCQRPGRDIVDPAGPRIPASLPGHARDTTTLACPVMKEIGQAIVARTKDVRVGVGQGYRMRALKPGHGRVICVGHELFQLRRDGRGVERVQPRLEVG
jgi:hypothetical protein